MAREVRTRVVDDNQVSVYHCINRCVRGAYLHGQSPFSGRECDYRPQVQQRLEFLAGHFGVDVLSFAIMGDHLHVVLRNRPDAVQQWSDELVASRWTELFPPSSLVQQTKPPSKKQEKALSDERRARLYSISWFMRCLSEQVARQANRDEQYSGRFWGGRFRCQRLLDEAGILACAAFVDLNPIRVGQAATLATCQYTSARLRWQARSANKQATRSGDAPDSWLAPVKLVPGSRDSKTPRQRASNTGFLPLSAEEYLRLLEWTGQQIRREKRGVMPGDIAAILERLKVVEDIWVDQVRNFSRWFQRVAGRPEAIAQEAAQRGQQWMQGLSRSREVFR